MEKGEGRFDRRVLGAGRRTRRRGDEPSRSVTCNPLATDREVLGNIVETVRVMCAGDRESV